MGCGHTPDGPGGFAARVDDMPGDGRGAARRMPSALHGDRLRN